MQFCSKKIKYTFNYSVFHADSTKHLVYFAIFFANENKCIVDLGIFMISIRIEQTENILGLN